MRKKTQAILLQLIFFPSLPWPGCGATQPAKIDLNKKSLPMQKTIQNSNIDAQGGQIGRHWLAGNSHFPCGRIFIFCFSEPLGINSEVLNSLLLGKGLFIQIYFGGLCATVYA